MNLSFEIAKQTILQSQIGISVATNNISNSKVDGYSRQNVNFKNGVYISKQGHLVGTGAVVNSIDRLRLGFYDSQYRDNIGIYSYANTMVSSLKRMETFFGTLDGDTGLKSTLTDFFNSLEELSKAPESVGAKQIVKDSGIAVAQSFNQVASNLKTMSEQYEGFIKNKVTDINRTLNDLNTLNQEIGRLTSLGESPNGLLDERDKLIDILSKDMDISIVHTDNNKINVISNGNVMIQDGYVNELSVALTNPNMVVFKNGKGFNSENGELKALIDTSSVLIPKYREEIDRMAKDFIVAFNNIHSKGISTNGKTGLNFFEGTDAASIRLSDEIAKDISSIATSSDGTSGNNDIVLELIELQNAPVINANYGIIEFYDKIATDISTETKAMVTKQNNYKYISDEIYIMRSNEIGVNEDEEILSASNYQKTFAAASKILQTIEEMFNSLMQAI